MIRDEGPGLIIMALHKKHNAEDVRLKARPNKYNDQKPIHAA